MTSAIDELLEDLRGSEAAHREVVAEQLGGESRLASIAADILALQIAAVEELVMFKANHTGGLVSDATVTLAPTVGLQPGAILDPPEP